MGISQEQREGHKPPGWDRPGLSAFNTGLQRNPADKYPPASEGKGCGILISSSILMN